MNTQSISKMPGVRSLEKEELQNVDGGSISPVAMAGIIAGIAVAWISVCDKVEKIGRDIGKALAK